MKNVKIDWKSVRLNCQCDHKYDFGPSQFGQPQTCAECGIGFVVPCSPQFEAFKALEWSVKPLGTHRKTPLARLCRYGEKPHRTEFYFAGDVSYERLIWPDADIWVRSADLDRLMRGSKGKRQPYPVEPPVIDRPGGELVHVGSIN